MRCVTVLGGIMAVVTLNPEGSIRLLSAILWELPALPLAACRDRPGEFDERHVGESRERQAQRLDVAVAVCRGCPELAVCEGLPLPRGGGAGVQAGRVLVALGA